MLYELSCKKSTLLRIKRETIRTEMKSTSVLKGEMKMAQTNMLSRKSFRRAFAFMLIGVLSLMLTNSSSQALLTTTHAASSFVSRAPEKLQPPPVNVTPPVTLADGQTLRLNFFNAGGSPIEVNPCFLDADGLHLKMTGDISIGPGQTRFYDLSRSEAGRRTEPSVDVRGAVHADAAALQQLAVSGEVFDDLTGKSLLFVPGESEMRKSGGDPASMRKAGGGDTTSVRKGGKDSDYLVATGDASMRKAGGPPELTSSGEVTQSLAPVGITFGQKLRLSFFNAGARPFEITPCYFDADGVHLKMGESFILAPGQTRSFEISRSEVLARDARILVRGALHVGRPDAPYLIAAGVIIDELTGKGSLYVLTAAPVGVDPQAGPPDVK